MIKYIYSITIIFIIGMKVLMAQEFLIKGPYQLGLSTSTARVSGYLYAHSALAQSFFNNKAHIYLNYYSPFNQLTDSKMYSGSLGGYTPSFSWGSFSLAYTQFSVENLDKQILSNTSIDLGYVNSFYKRLIVAAQIKRQNVTWYYNSVEDISVSGFGLDISTIYIINGISSVGLDIKNIIRPTFSSTKNDGDPRRFTVAYNWLNNDENYSFEGGIIVQEDYLLNHNIGAFINSELNLPYGINFGAEYKRIMYNELGAVFSFNYSTANFDALISYAVRFDDSPFPVSSLRQALGVSFSLNSLSPEYTMVNPQILYRDDISPEIYIEPVSAYTTFTNKDGSDNFKVNLKTIDMESGLSTLSFKIAAFNDSSRIIYKSDYSLKGPTFNIPIEFDGQLQDGNFISNGKYFALFEVADIVGNVNRTNTIPFRVLSAANDSIAPIIEIDFDTTEVIVDQSRTDYLVQANVSIDDKESNWTHWRVELYHSEDDSSWKKLKLVSGNAEILNKVFKWLIIKGNSTSFHWKYKIRVEANDEVGNKSYAWSARKRVTIKKPEINDTAPIHPVYREPEVVFLPERDGRPNLPVDQSFEIEASYLYRDREVTLTNFIFTKNHPFNVSQNAQGLSVIGVYLQDFPESVLVIESPQLVSEVSEFEEEIRTFFNEAYGVKENRIKIVVNKRKNLHFIINE